MKLKAQEVLLESIKDKLHIDILTAWHVIQGFVTPDNFVPERIFNEVVSKLSDEEKKLFIAMLTGMGIKVLIPQESPEIKTLSRVAQELTETDKIKLEEIKSKILEKISEEGIIEPEELQKVIDEIDEAILKAKIMEWLTETKLLKVAPEEETKEELEVIQKESSRNPKKVDFKETEYRKRIRKKVKKVTGEEVIDAFWKN